MTRAELTPLPQVRLPRSSGMQGPISARAINGAITKAAKASAVAVDFWHIDIAQRSRFVQWSVAPIEY
jgi:hypothetical protein